VLKWAFKSRRSAVLINNVHIDPEAPPDAVQVVTAVAAVAAVATVAAVAAMAAVTAAKIGNGSNGKDGSNVNPEALRDAVQAPRTPRPVRLQEHLRTSLFANAVRVIDLFREWDVDADGCISRTEFSYALPLLGIQASKEQTDALFEDFDTDGSGEISFKEFNKMVRRPNERAGHAYVTLLCVIAPRITAPSFVSHPSHLRLTPHWHRHP
jgi:hypothetical protein